jgi:hypothetical protein
MRNAVTRSDAKPPKRKAWAEVDACEDALRQISRRPHDEVLSALAEQIGRSGDFGRLHRRDKDKLAQQFLMIHDKIGHWVVKGDRLFDRALNEAGR